MDVLSDVLQAIRLQGALFFNGEFEEPWCVEVETAGELVQILRLETPGFALCHTVLEGRCWVELEDGQRLALQAGDTVVFPYGHSHIIGSGLQHAPVSTNDLIKVVSPNMRTVRYGGGGDLTRVVCGWFAYEDDIPHPILKSLPNVFVSSFSRQAAGEWLRHSISYVTAESAVEAPGTSAVATRVAEALFVESLRSYIDHLPDNDRGWLAGLRDPHVGKCLALMHADPARDWSVDALAEAVHSSRSVLAQRFNELVGTPPIQYLIRWRMAKAARLLRGGRQPLGRIAEAIGYESEAAFCRAFKKEFGITPGKWRSGDSRGPALPA
ncbi:MAG: AraC family transcriptional regulator [Moraxellaceae bacterium]|nr:AraC family transcriptional regulator [Moraxellaceae bacterium]